MKKEDTVRRAIGGIDDNLIEGSEKTAVKKTAAPGGGYEMELAVKGVCRAVCLRLCAGSPGKGEGAVSLITPNVFGCLLYYRFYLPMSP